MAGILVTKNRRAKARRRTQPTRRMLIQAAGGKRAAGIKTEKRGQWWGQSGKGYGRIC